MFRVAKEKCDIVIVGANSDTWLNRKKGKAFMPLVERIEILKAIKYIDYVWMFNDEDDTACKLIDKVIQKFSVRNGEFKIFFGNGGDRTNETTPEIEFCNQHNVDMIWGVGGEKIQSSSDLINNSKI
tara:strand:+ start:3086 stop:3466 length:381 start_codon:yes stop_codon:yes gene_type:complete